MSSNTPTTIHERLIAAQAAMEQPRLDATNSEHGNKYSSLAEVLRVVKKPLNDQGLLVSQPIVTTYTEEGFPRLEVHTVVKDGNGEVLELAVFPIRYSRIQEMVGEITYAKRVSLCAAFGLAGEEDDDGNSAPQTTPEPPPAPEPKAYKSTIRKIEKLRGELKVDDETFAKQLAVYHVEKVEDLTRSAAKHLLDAYEARMAEKAT